MTRAQGGACLIALSLASFASGPQLAQASPIRFANPPTHAASAKKSAKKSRGKKHGKTATRGIVMPIVNGRRQSPSEFVDLRVQKIVADLGARPLRAATVLTRTEIDTAANRQQFLNSIYGRGLVDASWSSEMMADKLIMARLLERELGSKAKVYYPKTMGLREFLVKKGFVDQDGQLVKNGDRIEAALHDEFPSGYVIRPAVGVAPTETMRGIYPESDQFIVDLLKTQSPLYTPQHLRQPVVSHLLKDVASGEAVVIQESIVGSADAHKALKRRQLDEVRVHTFEGRVVENAVPDRWVKGQAKISPAEAKAAEAFVTDFLKNLPLTLVNRQAWAVDVAVADNGEMRVLDIVTNCGSPASWSGSLDQPRVLGAYARHFENFYGLRFSGLSGTLLRHNFGNYVTYWGKRIDRAHPGVDRLLAYLPPVP